MKNKIKGILLEEVNRARQIMGLSLLTEGTIYDEIAEFFTRVGKSSVDDLSAEERAIFNKLVNNSTSLQSAGIRSIDDLLDPALKSVFLTTLSKSKNEIINAFTKSIDNYTSDALSKIRNNMSLDLDNMVKTTQVSNQGSVLDILKKVETDGVSSVRPQTLTLLKSELENIKLKPSILANADNIKYVDEMISQIDDNINLRRIDFGKQIDDVAVVGTSTKGSFDEILADVGATYGQTINKNDEYVKSIKKLYDEGVDPTKLKNNLESYLGNLERRSKDNTLSAAQRKEAKDKLDHALSVMGKIGGTTLKVGESVGSFISNFLKNFSKGKNSTVGGLINFLLLLGTGAGAAYMWDDAVYGIQDLFGLTNDCLDAIPGYKTAVLDPGWFFTQPIVDFMDANYPKEDVCYSATDIPNEDQISEFKLLNKGEDEVSGYDNFDIVVTYKEGCTDTIEIRTDMYENWILGFKDKTQKCGPRKGTKVEDEDSTDTGGGDEEKKTEESTEEKPSVSDFESFIKRDWGSDITGNETYSADTDYYYVNDGKTTYRYSYNASTKGFENVRY